MKYLTLKRCFLSYIENLVFEIGNKICTKNQSSREEIKHNILAFNNYSVRGCYSVLSYLIYMINEEMINCSKANYNKLVKAHSFICDIMYKN